MGIKKNKVSKEKSIDLIKKRTSIKRRRNNLIRQILRGESQKLSQKVAHILNQFPKTRNSDITLIIYLLRTFYPEFIRNESLSLNDLYKFPHFYDMQRERARIQNEFKLFQASPEVRAFRHKHQTEEAERFATTTLDYRPVFISADESGKNEKYLIIGSLWLYSSRDYHGAIENLKKQEKDVPEFHYTKIKNDSRAHQAALFFETFYRSGYFSSFKALILKNSEFAVSNQLKAVYNGLAEILIEGTKAEFKSRRISAPIILHVTKDSDIHTDVLQLPPMNRRIVEALNIEFQDKSVILDNNKVKSERSEKSDLIQIVDIFTGSINRLVNVGLKDVDKDPKDWLANHVSTLLGVEIGEDNKLIAIGDACKIIYLD